MTRPGSSVATVALAAILVAGAGLRVATSLAPGSLWFDELATALNATERGWDELLEPLGYRQVAPLGFIAAEKAGTALVEPAERGLRLFPLVASLASLFLFWRVAARYLDGSLHLAATALFAFSPAMVWYARKAKQYAGDVLVTLVLVWLSLRFLEGRDRPRDVWLAGVGGGLLILVSQPAALVAGGLLLVLLLERWRSGEAMRPAWPLAACWSAGAAAQVLTTLRLTEDATQDFMTRAWGYFFFPLRYDSFADALWLPRRLFDFVAFLVGYLEVDSPWEGLFTGTYFALALLGMFHLARERRPAVAVLFVPLAVAVLASVARVLPMTGRLMIYAGPTLFVSILAGVAAARFLAAPRLRRVVVAGGVTLGVLPALLLPVLVPVLSRREDAGTVLREVRDRWREGDVAYVYEGAFQAMRFYGEPLGLRPWIVGGHEGPDARSHLREVDALRGRDRAWLFYTHGSRCEIEVIRSYLETIGTEVAAVEDPGGNTGMHRTEARLYDLSDPARLTRSGAERHPVLERGDPRCRARQTSVGSAIKRRLWELLRRASGSPAR